MSTTTANGAGGLPNAPSYQPAGVGQLEQKHMRHANYRAVALESQVTPTHRHIAVANGPLPAADPHAQRFQFVERS